MCGVPVERADDYLQRLIAPATGSRSASRRRIRPRRKQRGDKIVVRRDVVRLVTPGTLTEDTLLDARTQQLPAGDRARPRLAAGGDRIGARLDRHFDRPNSWSRNARRAELAATLARIDPNEIIVTDALYGDPDLAPLLRELPAVTPLTRDVFDGATAERRLCDYFAVATLDGLGRDVAAGGDRGGRRRHLYRPHAGRQTPAAVAAVARGRRHARWRSTPPPAPISN